MAVPTLRLELPEEAMAEPGPKSFLVAQHSNHAFLRASERRVEEFATLSPLQEMKKLLPSASC
jgi:hypothetical protein